MAGKINTAKYLSPSFNYDIQDPDLKSVKFTDL